MLITVTTLSDTGTGSLRAAIALANASPGSTINFGTLSGTITIASSLPSITAATTITGAGAMVTIHGSDAYCAFNVSGNVSINNLTIRNVNDNPTNLGGPGVYVNSGVVQVANCTFLNCSMGGGTNAQGAAIHVGGGSVVITNCTFANCQSPGGASTIFNLGGSVFIGNSTFTANTASGSGYTIWNLSGNMSITNCIVYGNTSILAELHGSITVSYSDIAGGASGTGNINASPQLGSLTNNGGSVNTMALDVGSPCIATGKGGVNMGASAQSVQQLAVSAVLNYTNALCGTQYTLNPSGNYSLITDGYQVVDTQAITATKTLAYATTSGARVSQFDGNGYLVSSMFTPTAAPSLPKITGTTSTPTGAENCVAQYIAYVLDPTGSTYSVNPSGNYKTTLDGFDIVDLTAAAISSSITFDTVGGSRVVNLDASGHIVSTLFTAKNA
jgi:hypothetical protein